MHICLSLSYSSLTRYVGSIEVTPWKGCGDCVCHTGFVRDFIVFADSWSAFVSSMAFFCFCVPFLLWNSRSSLHSLQASICRKSHSSLFHFHLSTSLHNALDLKSNIHLTRSTTPTPQFFDPPYCILMKRNLPVFRRSSLAARFKSVVNKKSRADGLGW